MDICGNARKHQSGFARLALAIVALLCGCTQVEITTVNGPTYTACGGFFWRVKFKSKEKAGPTGGWLVQELNVAYRVRNCDKTSKDTTTKRFYEAWRIEPGKDRPALPAALGLDFDDQYSSPDQGASLGIDPPGVTAKGRIKYFDGVELPATMIPNNPETFAGILHSDTAAPPFWNASGADAHQIKLHWDCCQTPPTHTTGVTIPRTGGMVLETDESITGESVSELLHRIPAWTERTYDAHALRRLLRVTAKISVHGPERIREAIRTYAQDARNRPDGTARLSKLYLMQRVLFQVPANMERSKARTFGGWLHPSGDDGRDDFLLAWPLQLDGARPTGVQAFRGYFGLPYDAVAEFDYFAGMFELRSLSYMMVPDPETALPELLDRIPAWTGAYHVTALRRLLDVTGAISAQRPERIREAIHAYTQDARNRPDGTARLSKVYLMLRALFQVPERIERTKARTFGGWVHPSGEDGRDVFLLAWPLQLDDGRPTGVQAFRGYFGLPYDAVAEFDYFAEMFELRRF